VSSSLIRSAMAARALRPLARPVPRTTDDVLRHGARWRTRSWWGRGSEQMEWQRANTEHFERSLADQREFEAGRLPVIGYLWGQVFRRDGSTLDLGLMSCRVVTDAGVGFLIDALQGLVEPEIMRHHGIGTSSTAEAAGQTALGTELTTQYTPDNTRATGSLGEKSGDPKTFETVATITVDATVAATEHGLFSQAATGGGVMFDRSVFSVVNLAATESLATTYQFTLPSGG
jgi:hypothetical protein